MLHLPIYIYRHVVFIRKQTQPGTRVISCNLVAGWKLPLSTWRRSHVANWRRKASQGSPMLLLVVVVVVVAVMLLVGLSTTVAIAATIPSTPSFRRFKFESPFFSPLLLRVRLYERDGCAVVR